jgi:hypothetical protein
MPQASFSISAIRHSVNNKNDGPTRDETERDATTGIPLSLLRIVTLGAKYTILIFGTWFIIWYGFFVWIFSHDSSRSEVYEPFSVDEIGLTHEQCTRKARMLLGFPVVTYEKLWFDTRRFQTGGTQYKRNNWEERYDWFIKTGRYGNAAEAEEARKWIEAARKYDLNDGVLDYYMGMSYIEDGMSPEKYLIIRDDNLENTDLNGGGVSFDLIQFKYKGEEAKSEYREEIKKCGEMAVFWLEKARDNALAREQLGRIYKEGWMYVPQNQKKAEAFLV